jgi:hypothetical protein
MPGPLPEDGEVTIGLVTLPQGRRLTAGRWPDPASPPFSPVMWVTDEPLADAGSLWWFLHGQSDLVPLILDSLDAGSEVGSRRPWDGELARFEGAVPGFDAVEGILQFFWDDADDRDEDRAPFVNFPGLAPSQADVLPESVLAEAAMSQSEGRLGLVPATSPADAPNDVGWYLCSDAFASHWGTWDAGPAMTALLRSWEQRFGARVMRLGWASMVLLVERPPTTEQAAVAVAAELKNIASEFHTTSGDGSFVSSVRDIASGILRAPTWRFWWD